MRRQVISSVSLAFLVLVFGFASWGNASPGGSPIEDNEPTTIRVFADHTSMIAGFSGTRALFVQRYDAEGVTSGAKMIAVPFREGILTIGKDQELYAAATQADGSFAVRRFAAGSGKLQWLMPYVSNVPQAGRIVPVALVQDPAGNLFVSAAYSTKTGASFLTLKIEGLTGTLLWGPAFFGAGGTAPMWNVPTAMALDPDGNVVVTGSSTLGGVTHGSTLMYHGITGDRMWGPAILKGTGRSDIPVAVACGLSGVTVTARSATPGGSAFGTIRYDRLTGMRAWGPVFMRGTGQAVPTALAIDDDEDVYVTGYATQGLAGNRFATVKYNGATGMREWGPSIVGRTATPVAIACHFKYVIVSGNFYESQGDIDYMTVQYDGNNGKLHWMTTDDEAIEDYAVAMVLDHVGDAYVTGMSMNGSHCRATVAKYDLLNGKLLWKK